MPFITPLNSCPFIGTSVSAFEAEEEPASGDSQECCSMEPAAAWSEITRAGAIPIRAIHRDKKTSLPLDRSPASPTIFSGLQFIGAAGCGFLDAILKDDVAFYAAVSAVAVLAIDMVFFTYWLLMQRRHSQEDAPPPPIRMGVSALTLPTISRIPEDDLTPESHAVLRPKDAARIDESKMRDLLERLVNATAFEDSSISPPDADALDGMAEEACMKIRMLLNSGRLTIPVIMAETVLRQWILQEAHRVAALERENA